MKPNPYQSPDRLEDEQYEPPWDDEAEKATRKKWTDGLSIFALVAFLTPLIGFLTVAAMGVLELVIYIVYRLFTWE